MFTRQLNYLALGDSYTIGEGISCTENWPMQLAARLQAQNIPLAAPTILAQTGWTTRDLIAALQKANLTPGYDLVSLLIGVNNQYRGESLTTYRVEFQELLYEAIRYARNSPQRVIVLSIPHWEKTPYAKGRDQNQISVEIQQFNRVNQAETCQAQAHYFNFSALCNQILRNQNLLTKDQLHPSAQLYAKWVAQISPVAGQLLKNQVEYNL